MSLDTTININVDELTLFIEENTVVNVPLPMKLGGNYSKIIVTNYMSIVVPQGTRIMKGNNIYAIVKDWIDAEDLSKIPDYNCVFKQILPAGNIIIDNCGIKRKLEFDLEIEIPKNTNVILPIGTKLQNVDISDDCTQQQKVCEVKLVDPDIKWPTKNILQSYTENPYYSHAFSSYSKKREDNTGNNLKDDSEDSRDELDNSGDDSKDSSDESDNSEDNSNDDPDDDSDDDFENHQAQDQNKEEFDFASMTQTDISTLDLENPKLLDSLNMESFPVYDELSEDEQYNKYKAYFIKLLVMGAIVEDRRNNTFKKLKSLQSSRWN